MADIGLIAEAILNGDALLARSLTQDFLRARPFLSETKSPAVQDAMVLVLAAALIELFAMRSNQTPPPWTQVIGTLSEPVYLLKSAYKMKRLRELCRQDAPEPLRKRNLFAPANYLEQL
jgi:hypothetical protein